MTLKEKAVRGYAWITAGSASSHAIVLVSTIILARLLSPDDFGILGLAVLVESLFQLVRDLGLGSAIVQKQDVTGRQVSGLFWLNACLSVLCGAVVLAGAAALGSFFGEPALGPVLRVLCLSFLLAALEMVPLAFLRRELRF